MDLVKFCKANKRESLLEQWNSQRNNIAKEKIGYASHKKVWWKCDHGHEWQASVENRAIQGNACPYCSGRKALAGFNDLATLYPEVAAEWCDELNTDVRVSDVRPGSGRKVWWKCNQGHTWEARIFSRTSDKRPGCPVCAGRKAKGVS